MNYERFIAKRILSGTSKGKGSGSIVRIAVIGIAAGMAVMILAVAIVTGFQKEIRNKIIGFGGHIRISNFDSNSSFESKPVKKTQELFTAVENIPGVKHMQSFSTKAGIAKTKDEIEGLVLKGIGPDFDWSFFRDKITEGKMFELPDSSPSKGTLISTYTARKLKLKTGDKLVMYFIQQPPRARDFIISGIYETGLEDFDKRYLLCDMRHIQKLNDWAPDQVSGFEVLLENFDKLDETGKEVYTAAGYNLDSKTIKELFPQIFDWLGLQDINALIIIVLMISVAGINMISALLIMILERTNMIGILKALGASSVSIRRIFLYTAAYLVGWGMLAGDILGLVLCFIQKYFKLVPLDQTSYYVSSVPIHLPVFYFALLNVCTLIICIAMLIIPSQIISKITPVKAIRFA